MHSKKNLMVCCFLVGIASWTPAAWGDASFIDPMSHGGPDTGGIGEKVAVSQLNSSEDTMLELQPSMEKYNENSGNPASRGCTTCPSSDAAFDMRYWWESTTRYDLLAAYDCKMFQFHLEGGNTYGFSLCTHYGDASFDTTLTLYNSSCSQVAYNDDSSVCGTNRSYLEYTVPAGASGYYYLKVAGFSTNFGYFYLAYTVIQDHCYSCPSFDYDVSSIASYYQLSPSFIEYSGYDPSIPNPPKPCRYWRFYLYSGTQYRFTFCESGFFSGDGQMYLYNPSCSQVAYNDDCPSGQIWPEITYSATTTGYHYVKVTQYYDLPMSGFQLAYKSLGAVATLTPTVTSTPTFTPTRTPTVVPPTFTPTFTPTRTPTGVPPTVTSTFTPTRTPTGAPGTLTPTYTPTRTPTGAPGTPTLTPTPTRTPTGVPATPTATPYGGGAATLTSWTTCKGIDSGTGDYIDPTNYFRDNDDTSYMWLYWTNVSGNNQVEWRWFTPSGAYYNNCYTDMNGSYSYFKTWCGIYIYHSGVYYGAADNEGYWRCEIYRNGSYVATQNFYIRFRLDDQGYVADATASSHTICTGLDGNFLPINPGATTFMGNDLQAESWVRFTNVLSPVNVKWEYYRPNGTLYGTSTTSLVDPGVGYYYPHYEIASWLNIDGQEPSWTPGLWRVAFYTQDVWSNWDYEWDDTFTIIQLTSTPTLTPSLSPTLTPTWTATPTWSPTQSPSLTPTLTLSPTQTLTPSPSPTSSPTASVSPTLTPSDSPTRTPTWTATPTWSPTQSSTLTPTITLSPTLTPTPSSLPTSSPTASLSPTLTPSRSPTLSPTGTSTPTWSPTQSPTLTPSPTGSPTPSISPTWTPTFSQTPTTSPSLTPTATATLIPSFTPTAATPTTTPTPTHPPIPALDGAGLLLLIMALGGLLAFKRRNAA